MKRKKVGLVLGAKPEEGGTYQYHLTMIEALASLPQNNYEVIILCRNDNWFSFLEKYNLPSICQYGGTIGCAICKAMRSINFPLKWYRNISHFFHPTLKTIKDQGCDIWIFPAPDSLSYHTKTSSLVTIYDLMHRYERRFPEVSKNNEYIGREKNYKNICHWATGVIVDSQVGKIHVVESYGLSPDKIYILPYVAPEYIFSSTDKKIFNSRYSLPEKFILYPSKFWEHKNHKKLIQAVSLLKEKITDINVILIGSKDNNYYNIYEYVRKLNLNNQVHFLGYVPNSDIPEFYRRARALVMPTFFGPTNIPPMEAIALGCPVAISDVYGMREQLGNAAIYFNPNSENDIARSIEMIWNDDELCEKLTQDGYFKYSKWNQIHFNKRFKEIIDAVIDNYL